MKKYLLTNWALKHNSNCDTTIARGEMTETYSPEFISAYTQTMLRAIGEIFTSKNVAAPLEMEGEKLYDDFIAILKYGLCKRDAKQ